MILKKLEIAFANKGNKKLFEQNKIYEFKESTLITSDGSNSRGKTTLIRFIIYSLGFSIPLTDGMHGQNYKTKLEFTNKENEYIVERENEEIIVRRNGIKLENDKNTYLLNLFSLSSFEELDNFLGCFYIDQEKGWTLLNRGRIIGKRTFNIEKLISFLNKLDLVRQKIKENESLELEERKIRVLEEMSKIKADLILKEEEEIELKEVIDIERKMDIINSEVKSLRHQQNSLNNLLNDHKKFVEKLSLYGLKIKVEVDGKEKIYPIKTDNIVGFNSEDKFIKLEIDDLENEIEVLEKEKKKWQIRLEYMINREEILAIDEIISKLNVTSVNIENLLLRKRENFKKKKINNIYIKEELNNKTDVLWGIMREVLIRLDVSKEYITKDIIFRDRLSGISGTQLHKLTYALKLSLLVLIKRILNINLPLIIDSPMSGEVNQETANLMLNLAKEMLKDNQVIVSSVYDVYDLKFNKKIILDETGVLGDLASFLYNE